ncbi:aminotransferase class V-fold PLP-dependent enzyme [Pseudobdellovibrio sp. HCB154]|uniref:aminotransferase class V-fold PLP-dependent enzyme n=1 Tax=Pseudobdellovibrio sp. HCB154 TaxID=3386277 RepID=UPI003916E0A5
MSSLEAYKAQFNRNELVHLNNAGLQPITRAAREKIDYWSRRFWEEGYNTDKDYAADVANTRASLASMIGCEAGEVAFFSSTAGAISQVAFSCGLNPGDEVLMWDQEYGSHLYPWKAACDQVGANLVIVESEKNLATPMEKYLKAITAKTKVMAFSWVQFQAGSQMEDIKHVIETAKQNGIFVSVDIIQGFGLHPCEIWNWGADAVMGGSHKWLSSPVGVGYLALRKNHIAKFKPHVIGMYTYGTCDDPSDFACVPKRDALKFEPGSKQVLEIAAMGASIEVLQKTGIKNIETEALRLAKIFRQGLMNLGYEIVSPYQSEKINSTPFINVKPRGSMTNKELSDKLNKEKIFHAVRGPGLRFTPNAFNTETDLEKALFVLK